jgi:predicted ATP-dependent endonuclease of OLD family
VKITKIRIKYFRSIEFLEFEPNETTVICGSNSSGKSNVLRALRLAFRTELTQPKLGENISSWMGPNAKCQISITFDQPTKTLAQELGIQVNKPFTYRIAFKRSGQATRIINSKNKLDDQKFEILRDSILLIYVPAIRDIGVDGLKPFKDTLLSTLRKHKGNQSLTSLNNGVRNAISERGKAMLSSTKSLAKEWMGVDQLQVDANLISVDSLLDAVGIKVKIGGASFELNKLGTGHQSAVVIKLYRELGVGTGKSVIYLFEEPDNHLHPTSIKVVADELADCINQANGQVLLTTHSPYLLNHYAFDRILALYSDNNRITQKRKINVTRTNKNLRIAMSKFGLRPAEALLSKKVIVVEGMNDANAIRTFITIQTNITPECQDIMIINAGGKALVSELCDLLDEIGAKWLAIYDWDAIEDTNQPLLNKGLNSDDKKNVTESAQLIKKHLLKKPTKTSKIFKQLEALENEVNQKTYRPNFSNSVIAKFISSKSRLPATQISLLKKAAAAAQNRSVNKILENTNIFIWKGVIEEVVVPLRATISAEVFLESKGLIIPNPNPSDRRKNILRTVKNLSHQPEIMAELIEYLWVEGFYKQQEIIKALTYLLH